MNINFVKYDGVEGYIEVMKHDVEPLNNPECKKIELCYDGKDIKAVLDYITNLQEELKYQKEAELEYNEKYIKLMQEYANLQEENERLNNIIKEVREYIKHSQNYGKEKITYINGNDILEILDKGKDNE